MPPRKTPTPDFTAVLELLSKQQTEHHAKLIDGINQISDRAKEDREVFRDSVDGLRVATENNTKALTELKASFQVKERDCQKHDEEIKSLRKEVTGTDPSNSDCSVKSRVTKNEETVRALETKVNGIRDTHHERLNSLEASRNTAVQAGGTWLIKILWAVIIFLITTLGWLAKTYYVDIAQHHSAPPTQTK